MLLRHIASIVALTLTMAACGPSVVALTAGPKTPAAAGQVSYEVSDNDNVKFTVDVKHLAAPDKVMGGATTYVVWVKAGDKPAQNVGALKVDEELSGRLETVTPNRSFEVFVTPETEVSAASPSGERVLFAKIDG